MPERIQEGGLVCYRFGDCRSSSEVVYVEYGLQRSRGGHPRVYDSRVWGMIALVGNALLLCARPLLGTWMLGARVEGPLDYAGGGGAPRG